MFDSVKNILIIKNKKYNYLAQCCCKQTLDLPIAEFLCNWAFELDCFKSVVFFVPFVIGCLNW